MTDAERNVVLRILELLIGSSKAAMKAIPKSFRPAEVQRNLDEATELLNRLKAGLP